MNGRIKLALGGETPADSWLESGNRQLEGLTVTQREIHLEKLHFDQVFILSFLSGLYLP